MSFTSEIHLANRIPSNIMEEEDIPPATFLLSFPDEVAH